MSTKTRRAKRKTTAEQPIETDWLWSCPMGLSQGEIARRLGITGEPSGEFSIRAWDDDLRARDDLYRAIVPGFRPEYYSPHLNWDAADEHLTAACERGRLIVLRDLRTPLPSAVQMLIHVIGFRQCERGFLAESHPASRFALVLAGWTEPNIRVRFRHTEQYAVHPLPQKAEKNSPPPAFSAMVAG